MPPRLPASLQACAELASSAHGARSCSNASLAATASPLEHALLGCRALPSASAARAFSTSSAQQKRSPLHPKSLYRNWLKKDGRLLKNHTPNETNYLENNHWAKAFDKSFPTDLPRPFPSNPTYVSQPVLSEAAREEIYRRVTHKDEPIKVVSADLGVDHRRVAAVVRMKEIEKQWEKQGIPLAKQYSRAIHEMVPTHPYSADGVNPPFEAINEIHVHGYTMQQLFVPTSESREFTREDAAKAFHHTMRSADERIPHKELVEHHRRVKDGMTPRQSREKFIEEAKISQQMDEAKQVEAAEWEKKITTAVTSDRFEFRFKKMAVEDVGQDGRSRRGVGWRYGLPSEDRKKNQIKIPTKID